MTITAEAAIVRTTATIAPSCHQMALAATTRKTVSIMLNGAG